MQQQSHTIAPGILVTALLLCTGLSAWAAQPLPIPSFANLPLVTNAQLSPDGKYMAFFFNKEGDTVLATRNLKTGEQAGIVITDNSKFVLKWLRWANNERLIFSVYYPARRYWVATGESRLMSAARDGRNTKPLAKPRDRKKGGGEHMSQFADRVVSYLPDDPDHILLALDTTKMNLPEVWKVNVHYTELIRPTPFLRSLYRYPVCYRRCVLA